MKSSHAARREATEPVLVKEQVMVEALNFALSRTLQVFSFGSSRRTGLNLGSMSATRCGDGQEEHPKLTAITLPVKVILGFAMTFQIQFQLLPCGTMGKWHVVVCYVIEEM
jgi:hypothetical protein